MSRRASLLAAAAALPPGARIPDELLFAEGFDPTDTMILAMVAAAPKAHGPGTETPGHQPGGHYSAEQPCVCRLFEALQP